MLFGGMIHIIGGIVALVLLLIDTKRCSRRTKRAFKITRVRKIEVKKKMDISFYYGFYSLLYSILGGWFQWHFAEYTDQSLEYFYYTEYKH